MHIAVVAVYPARAAGPIVRVIPGALQGDADLIADVHNGHVNIGEPMSGDADLAVLNGVNLEFSLPVALEGDADLRADFISAAYITGDRTASIEVRSTAQDSRGSGSRYDPYTAWVNGSFATNGTNSVKWDAGQTLREVTFDFRPSGFAQAINGMKWYQDVAASQGFWKMEAWDGLNWVTLHSGFTLGTSTTQEIEWSNSTAYLVYRMKQLSGSTSNTPWIEEVEFRQAAGPAVSTFFAGTAYTNTGGQGVRGTLINISTTFALNGGFNTGPITGLIDNITGSGPFVDITTGQTGKEIRFDFTPIGKQIIDEFKITYGSINGPGHFRFQGSNDGTTWTDVGTPMRLDGVGGGGVATFTGPKGNQRSWLMYRLFQNDVFASTGTVISEITFKIQTAIAADMSGDADLVGDVDTSRDTGLSGECGTTSYNNADGKGDRSTTVVVTPSGTLLSVGTGVEFVDGLFTFHAIGFNAGITNGSIKFNFGNPRIIDAFTWFNPSSASQGTWAWFGSNDDVTYTLLGLPFDLHGSTVTGGAGGAVEYQIGTAGVVTIPTANTTEYLIYELRQLSGSTTAIFPTEFQFRIACGRIDYPDPGALEGDADLVADVNVSAGGTFLINATEYLQINATETEQSEA